MPNPHIKPVCLFFASLFCLTICAIAFGQSKEVPNKTSLVRGKFVQSEKAQHKIEFNEYQIKIVEQVELPDVAPPKDWPTMTLDARQEYLEKFQASPEGKALIEKRQKLLDARHIYDVKIEPSGKWVVYDVPPGRYGILNGRIDKVVDGQKFAYEVFGQFDVSQDVDEIVLDPIQVLITPLLEAGNPAPPFKVSTHDNKATLALSSFKGKYVFVYFWSTESQPSLEYQADVQKMFSELDSKHELELLSVNMDEDRKKAVAAVIENKFAGRHGFTDGLEHEIADGFGVRSLPSQWLIGPDGKILLTNLDFRRLGMTGNSLAETVSNRILGKDAPTPAVETGNPGGF